MLAQNKSKGIVVLELNKVDNLNISTGFYKNNDTSVMERISESNIGGSLKATFRKFMAESNFQTHLLNEGTLSDQLQSGALQEKIKHIDPNTLIHRAIIENSPEVLAFLLKHHVDVDYPDANGMSPLTVSILSQQPEIVKLLLENGANVSPGKKWNDMSLLEITMSARDLDSMRYLIQFGADVNTTFQNGQSALGYAYSDFYKILHQPRNFDMVHILLESNRVNISDMNKLMPAISQMYSFGIRTEYDASNELLKKLIQKGANVNYDNGIALNHACRLKDVEKTRILLAHGANPNLTPTNSAPAIIQAANNLEVLSILLNSKANPNAIFEYKNLVGKVTQQNALVTAIISNEQPESVLQRVQLLVEAGADINRKINGKSPLEHALEKGRMDVVKYLLLKSDN